MARRTSEVVAPSITPERALGAFQKQLSSLELLRGKKYTDVEQEEEQWSQFTETLIHRAFGSASPNLSNFYGARSAGEYRVIRAGEPTPHARNQRNFETRQQAYLSVVKSCLAELELMLPDREVSGHYEPGQEFEFYRDLKSILVTASKSVLIVDPYLGLEIIELYLAAVSRAVSIRILTTNLPAQVLTVAQKYASGGNLELRTTNAIHDRVVFVDDRLWMIGQSIKDAAKKKPTYIVEHNAALVKPVYEGIWTASTRAV